MFSFAKSLLHLESDDDAETPKVLSVDEINEKRTDKINKEVENVYKLVVAEMAKHTNNLEKQFEIPISGYQLLHLIGDSSYYTKVGEDTCSRIQSEYKFQATFKCKSNENSWTNILGTVRYYIFYINI